MKKNMKFSSLLAATCLLLFTSCNKSSDPVIPEPKEPEITISLNEVELNMVIGDKTKLVATNSLDDKAAIISWFSTNDKIVTVNQGGEVEAIQTGEAYIIANYNDAKASCKVVVTSGFYLPTLNFYNDINDEEQVGRKGSLNLSTYISFNNKTFNDALITYEIENRNAGSMEGTIFVGADVSNVTTDITVKASWRNFDNPALSKKISVTVIDVKNIYLNGGELSDINLFTIDHVQEEEYKNIEYINSVTCIENGEIKNPKSVELIENIASEDASLPAVSLFWDNADQKGQISAIRKGTAGLKIAFEDSNGDDYFKVFDIEVNYPTYEIKEMIPDFSILDGKIYDLENDAFKSLSNYFPVGSSEIKAAKQNGKALTVDDDKVLGISSSLPNDIGEATITIYNDVVATVLHLEVYQKIVTDIIDFVDIYSSTTKDQKISGYYKLVKDLINSGDSLTLPTGRYVASFNGVFDGGAHVIKTDIIHGSNEEWGLFGHALGGIIKNTGFDCSMDGGLTGLLAHHSEKGGTISNVFVSNKINGSSDKAGYGLMYSTYGYLKVENVIVTVPELYDHNSNYGAFAVHKLAAGSRGLYIISKKQTYIGQTDKIKSYIWSAEGDDDTAFTGAKYYLSDSARWYPTFKDMHDSGGAAGNDYSQFSSLCWDLSTGIPVFNGLDYYTGVHS